MKKASLVPIASFTFIERVHFDLSYTTPRELGYRLLSMALSETAAQGILPQHVMMQWGATQEATPIFLSELQKSIQDLAKKARLQCTLSRNVTSPTAFIVTLTLSGKTLKSLGLTPRRGDFLIASGNLGDSAAGLYLLRNLGRAAKDREPQLIQSHLVPRPLVDTLTKLRKTPGISSIDILNEGLSHGVNTLAQRHRVGVLVFEEQIPMSQEAWRAGAALNFNPRLWALYGAEDYGVLFTCRPKLFSKIRRQLKALDLHIMGEIVDKSQGVRLRQISGNSVSFEPRGWSPIVRRTNKLVSR